MVVSFPVVFPRERRIAAIFGPRLKLASCVFCMLILTRVTSLSTGPELASSTSRSPAFQCRFRRQDHTQGRKHGLEIVHWHVLAVQLEIHRA